MRHMSPPRPRPAFPGEQTALIASMGRASISATRFCPTIDRGEAHVVKMRGEEAFVVLYQLLDHPAHEFKLDGRFEQTPAAPRGMLNIIDLRIGDACSRLFHPADTLMFHVPVAAIEEIVQEVGAEQIDGLRAQDPWRTPDPVVQQLAPILLDALSGAEEASGHLLHEHMLLGLGAHFAQRYGGLRRQPRPLRGGLAPWQERRAKEMLEADHPDGVSIRAIARECDLSPDYFTRAFRVSTGTTPNGWLQAHRIARAKDMLRDRNMPLALIAQACGFSDQSHFSRQFSRLAGKSPRDWRNSQG